MKRIILLVFLAVSLNSFSQSGEKNFIDQNYIEVTGKAEMNIVPDLIYLKIILSEKDNKNKQTLEEIEKSMINSMKALGIDISKDLSIKDYTSNFKSVWIGKTDIILTKEYQLIVHDTKVLQNVYLELTKLGISNVDIDRLDHSKIEQFRKEVKINAIKAAKEKADYLASALNQVVGKAIYVQELDNQYFATKLSNKVGGVSIKLRQDESLPEIEFEKIDLESSILTRFELK